MTDEARDYQDAIRACVENGKRLLEDIDWLCESARNPTTLALTILAEEEFAKAFFLYLLQDGVIPSTTEVWRTLRDHHCKHLLTVMMEYLHEGDDFIQRLDEQYDPKRILPRDVASAVNLLRFEKIRKWESPHSDVLEIKDYDREVKQLPVKIDRTKQSAIYVDVSREGKVISRPASITAEQIRAEQERCSRLLDLARQLEAGYVLLDRDFQRLKDAFNAVFTPPIRTDVGDVGDYIPGIQIYREEWHVVTLDESSEDSSVQRSAKLQDEVN